MVQLLLDYGADSSLQDLAGNTALHVAIQPQDSSILQQLLAHDHSVELLNIQNSIGYTPVHQACEVGNKDAIQMLLKGGADFQIKDYSGKSPIDYVESESAKAIFGDWTKVRLMHPVNVREICVPKT